MNSARKEVSDDNPEAFRAIQGASAAAMSPAALSIVTTLFPQGPGPGHLASGVPSPARAAPLACCSAGC
jgi:hypothetical protein